MIGATILAAEACLRLGLDQLKLFVLKKQFEFYQ